MFYDDPFDEFDRISDDRNNKDYWEYARALSESARIFKDRYKNWIAEEFKHLRFYCDMLIPNTNGAVRDKIQRQQDRMKELEEKSIQLLIDIDNFVRHIENKQAADLSDLLALRSQYKSVIAPVEHPIDVDLVGMRISLQDVLDTIKSEHPGSEG
jgi:hypothetical protein